MGVWPVTYLEYSIKGGFCRVFISILRRWDLGEFVVGFFKRLCHCLLYGTCGFCPLGQVSCLKTPIDDDSSFKKMGLVVICIEELYC